MAAVSLRVTRAGKAYHQGPRSHTVFAGVDIEVRTGEILALLGPSGCGKSTLLRTIAGLEPLDAGRVEVVGAIDPQHGVGIAFQEPSLLPWLTVAGNVGLGLRFAANRAAASPEVVGRTIEALGLDGVADSFPDELSGGQAQRANVARLIVTGRPVLLLDEPFAALDPATRRSLQDWLLGLRRSHQLSVVVVTHDVSEALRLGDRVALMGGTPPSIAHVWDVDAVTRSRRDRPALEALRREVLARYDASRSRGLAGHPDPAGITPMTHVLSRQGDRS